MLKILLFDNYNDLFSTHLQKLLMRSNRSLVVGPSPDLADDLRECIIRLNLGEFGQVTTMANFIREHCPQKENIQSKANVLLQLATAYKKIFPTKSFDSFENAYTLFSDLRGLGLQRNMLDQISDDIKNWPNFEIQLFSSILESALFEDEHSLYQDLESRLIQNEQECLQYKNYFFIGFHFFSLTQLSLFKAMSKYCDLYIPLPCEVWEEVKNDGPIYWCNWLTSFSEVILLDKENVEKNKKKQTDFPIATIFSKTLLPLILKESITNVFQEDLIEKKINIFFNSDSLKPEHQFIIPSKEVSFKIKHDIFGSEKDFFFEEFEKEFFLEKDKKIPLRKIHSWLKIMVSRKFSDDQLNNNQLRFTKIVVLFLSCLESWGNLSEINKEVSYFDFQLLKNVVSLNLPRTFSINLSQDKLPIKINSIKNFMVQNKKEHIFLCFFKGNDFWKQSNTQYPHVMLNALTHLGPLRNAKLDFLLNKSKLTFLFKNLQTKVFIEQGVLEEEVGLVEVVKAVNLKIINSTDTLSLPKGFDPLSINLKLPVRISKISATKLQSYVDCPRRYYYKYVEKVIPSITIEEAVPAHILGQIEHATIQQFLSAFKVNTQPNENLFLETALKEVRKNCFENQFNWGEELIQKISIQVLNECFETSAIFWNLKISYPHIKFYFEYKFSNKFQLHLNGERTDDILVEGSIDCLAKVDEKWFLFDFKRSGSSIPNQSEIDRLKKVQLHFYLNFIDIPIEDIIFYGFISLRDFSESLIYSASHTVEYSQFPFATKSGSPQKEVESFKEEFLKILGNMGHDLNYFPVVSREDYCNYCEFKNICPKMKIN